MIDHVIGIDPGKNTGLAVMELGDQLYAYTMTFWEAIDYVDTYSPDRTAIIVELPRSKHVWHGKGQNSKAMARTGVNVGSVIREAELLAERFISQGYTVVTVHPQGKVTAEHLKALTGYEGRTNEHTRDAIMLAWSYRSLISKRKYQDRE